jgi:hypothetical protein
MVIIQNKFGAIKVGLEMYDGPYNNKTFSLVKKVVASGCIADNIFLTFLTKLANNSTTTKSIPVMCKMKTLLKSYLLRIVNSESFSLSVLKVFSTSSLHV